MTRLAAEKLGHWGLTQAQIDGILGQGKPLVRVPILAPIGGVVVKKNVVEGQYVAEGEAMFEVADLSHVWVTAQVYEDEFAAVKVGQAVAASVAAFPGEVFAGTLAFIDPAFDPATRTVNVRYDLENPGLRLRPGMFAWVTPRRPWWPTPPPSRGRAAIRRASRSASPVGSRRSARSIEARSSGRWSKPVPVMIQGEKVWVCCAGVRAPAQGSFGPVPGPASAPATTRRACCPSPSRR